jgi:hypothetical protein
LTAFPILLSDLFAFPHRDSEAHAGNSRQDPVGALHREQRERRAGLELRCRQAPKARLPVTASHPLDGYTFNISRAITMR